MSDTPGTLIHTPKRTPPERERDLEEIAGMWLRGASQGAIAKAIAAARPYTLTRQTISRDCRTLIERWRESSIEKIEEMKLVQLAKLDECEAELWQAWERSKKDLQTMTKSTGGATPDEMAQNTKGSKTTMNRDGDGRIMGQILDVIKMRCDIIGAWAPKEPQVAVNVNAEDGATGVVVLALPPNGHSVESHDVEPYQGRVIDA